MENSFDFFRGKGFHFSFGVFEQVDVSPEPFKAGSEIHTIVTYDHETHFDVNKQVRSDNDASEVDILGHFGTFEDILGQFGRLYDEFRAYRPFS